MCNVLSVSKLKLIGPQGNPDETVQEFRYKFSLEYLHSLLDFEQPPSAQTNSINAQKLMILRYFPSLPRYHRLKITLWQGQTVDNKIVTMIWKPRLIFIYFNSTDAYLHAIRISRSCLSVNQFHPIMSVQFKAKLYGIGILLRHAYPK